MAEIKDFPQRPRSTVEEQKPKAENSEGRGTLIDTDARTNFHLEKIQERIASIREYMDNQLGEKARFSHWAQNARDLGDNADADDYEKNISEIKARLREAKKEKDKLEEELKKIWEFHLKHVEQKKIEKNREGKIANLSQQVKDIEEIIKLNLLQIQNPTAEEIEQIKNLHERRLRLLEEIKALIDFES